MQRCCFYSQMKLSLSRDKLHKRVLEIIVRKLKSQITSNCSLNVISYAFCRLTKVPYSNWSWPPITSTSRASSTLRAKRWPTWSRERPRRRFERRSTSRTISLPPKRNKSEKRTNGAKKSKKNPKSKYYIALSNLETNLNLSFIVLMSPWLKCDPFRRQTLAVSNLISLPSIRIKNPVF